jgi:hypothetical protein
MPVVYVSNLFLKINETIAYINEGNQGNHRSLNLKDVTNPNNKKVP